MLEGRHGHLEGVSEEIIWRKIHKDQRVEKHTGKHKRHSRHVWFTPHLIRTLKGEAKESRKEVLFEDIMVKKFQN